MRVILAKIPHPIELIQKVACRTTKDKKNALPNYREGILNISSPKLIRQRIN
jgi:hypothetical protein